MGCADSKQVAIILLLVDNALEIFLGKWEGKGERRFKVRAGAQHNCALPHLANFEEALAGQDGVAASGVLYANTYNLDRGSQRVLE